MKTLGTDYGCGNPAGDCCASVQIPGGTFNRDNNSKAPATVSPFKLDQFEVTVGRFRQFVNAYPGSKPKPGDGANTNIPGSGWDPSWDSGLPSDQWALIQKLKMASLPLYTWTDTPQAHERRPIHNVSWRLAFAFCAWDGGRLPTTAEWGFAACGGDEQRQYPWGSGFDLSYAVMGYEVQVDAGPDDVAKAIGEVGSRPKDVARWGQMDMGGNISEWVLDTWFDTYKVPCNDCALVPIITGYGKGVRGMNFGDTVAPSNAYWVGAGLGGGIGVGFRCAR